MTGPKELIPMIESDHNNRTPEKQGDWESRWRAVLKTLLSGGRSCRHRACLWGDA
jgi:hypothetical protein